MVCGRHPQRVHPRLPTAPPWPCCFRTVTGEDRSSPSGRSIYLTGSFSMVLSDAQIQTILRRLPILSQFPNRNCLDIPFIGLHSEKYVLADV